MCGRVLTGEPLEVYTRRNGLADYDGLDHCQWKPNVDPGMLGIGYKNDCCY